MTHSRSQTLTLLFGLLAAGGCSKPATPGTDNAAKPSASVVAAAALSPEAEAKKIYKTRCLVCHGESGKGDGAGAAAMNPKPQSLAAPEWQSKVTDEDIAKVIVEGGAAVGKSAGMPGNPDLASKKAVVNELVKIVRGFKS